MSIDPKKILESIIRNRLPAEDDSQIVKFTRPGDTPEETHSLSAYRDESGNVTGVTCQVSHDGRDIVLHSDEVIVWDRMSVRYYRFEGDKLHYKEHVANNEGARGKLDASIIEADGALIESARRMYLEALQEPDAFDVSGFFEE
jgi:hypothetical protein